MGKLWLKEKELSDLKPQHKTKISYGHFILEKNVKLPTSKVQSRLSGPCMASFSSSVGTDCCFCFSCSAWPEFKSCVVQTMPVFRP